MARLESKGFDEIYNQLRKMGEAAAEVTEPMIDAGAAEVEKAWRASAQKHGHVRTGDMLNAIATSAKNRKDANAIYREIYPQGKDRNGVRNATKAYILHYGTSKIPASYWVDEAEAAAQEPMTEAMRRVWDDFIDSRKE